MLVFLTNFFSEISKVVTSFYSKNIESSDKDRIINNPTLRDTVYDYILENNTEGLEYALGKGLQNVKCEEVGDIIKDLTLENTKVLDQKLINPLNREQLLLNSYVTFLDLSSLNSQCTDVIVKENLLKKVDWLRDKFKLNLKNCDADGIYDYIEKRENTFDKIKTFFDDGVLSSKNIDHRGVNQLFSKVDLALQADKLNFKDIVKESLYSFKFTSWVGVPKKLQRHFWIFESFKEVIKSHPVVCLNNFHGTWSKEIINSIKSSDFNFVILPLYHEFTHDSKYLSNCDAFVNPGAGDSFDSREVKKDYLDQWFKLDELSHEKAYQNVINYAVANNKPYMGICNGAQHLALNKGGTVLRSGIAGNIWSPITDIFVQKGSVIHFLAMNKVQQSKAVHCKEYKDMDFPGFVQHYYHADINNLGDGVELGAVAKYRCFGTFLKDTIDPQMTEAISISFYQVGFQFHPERPCNLRDYTIYRTYDSQYVPHCEVGRHNILSNVFRIFSASKTTDMTCLDSYLTKNFKETYSSGDLNVDEVCLKSSEVENADVLGDAINECGMCMLDV